MASRSFRLRLRHIHAPAALVASSAILLPYVLLPLCKRNWSDFWIGLVMLLVAHILAVLLVAFAEWQDGRHNLVMAWERMIEDPDF